MAFAIGRPYCVYTFPVRTVAIGHTFARFEMQFRKAEAFILKIYPFSESSLVIHTLARDHGRLHLLARGARRGKTRALAGLEPFCRVEISYVEKEGRDLQSLRESTLLEGNSAFRSKLGLWAAGSMFFELIDRATGGDDAAGGLFDLSRVFVDRAISLAEDDSALRGKGGDERGAAADVDALLPYCFAVFGCLGVAPLVGKCARCGETKGQFPLLDPEKGGVLCAACVEAKVGSAHSPRALPIDEGVRRILLRWLIDRPPLQRPGREQKRSGGDVRLLRGQRETLLRLLERLTAEHLEAPLKSLEVVRRLLKS